MTITLHIHRLPHAEGLPSPSYESAGAAGFDLAAALKYDQPLSLPPLERALVPTGLIFAIPPSYEAQIRPRSGLSFHHGLTLINAPGTIDSDYRGEIMLPLVNLGSETFTITRGMRVAQAVIAPVTRAAFREFLLEEGEGVPQTERGAGGFGSTGLHQNGAPAATK